MIGDPAATRVAPRKKYKVCLAGDGAVGKTSLVRRFVYDAFDDRYITTLGTKVTKKVVEVEMPDTGEPGPIALMIWDIMGQETIRDLLREAYFTGVRGVLLVCDLTRPATLESLTNWQRSVEEVAGPVPVSLLANKADLKKERKVKEKDVKALAQAWDSPYRMTSAKTGEGVEEAFHGLATTILAHLAAEGA